MSILVSQVNHLLLRASSCLACPRSAPQLCLAHCPKQSQGPFTHPTLPMWESRVAELVTLSRNSFGPHSSSITNGTCRLPWWLGSKESSSQCRRCRFNLRSGKIPWRRKRQPTRVFLPGKSHGQRILAGYSPKVCKRVRNDLATKQVAQLPFRSVG